MLLAGIETVSASLAWLLFELDTHPEVRSRLRHEAEAAGARAAGTGEVTPYMRNVLKENLRLHTPNWVLTRRSKRRFQHGGMQLPTGAEILFSPLAMHTDPHLYPRPQAFEPDRWTQMPALPRGAFTPFGAGVHKCIGETFALTETAAALSVVLASWNLTTTRPSRPRPAAYLATHQPRRLLMTVTRKHR